MKAAAEQLWVPPQGDSQELVLMIKLLAAQSAGSRPWGCHLESSVLTWNTQFDSLDPDHHRKHVNFG